MCPTHELCPVDNNNDSRTRSEYRDQQLSRKKDGCLGSSTSSVQSSSRLSVCKSFTILLRDPEITGEHPIFLPRSKPTPTPLQRVNQGKRVRNRLFSSVGQGVRWGRWSCSQSLNPTGLQRHGTRHPARSSALQDSRSRLVVCVTVSRSSSLGSSRKTEERRRNEGR